LVFCRIEIRSERRKIMKTRNTFLAALVVGMLGASSCATLNNAATEQEEIVSQIQKEQLSNPIPEQPGTWFDANGWEYEAMNDGD
jgi:hypothetical protein